jgi:hypothetical protein
MFTKVVVSLIAIMVIPFVSAESSEKPSSKNNRLYLYVGGEPGLSAGDQYYCNFNVNDPNNSGLDAGPMRVGLPLPGPCEIIYQLKPDLTENFSVDLDKEASAQITLSVYTILPLNAILPLTCKVSVLVEDRIVLYGSSDVVVTPFVENKIEMTLDWAENATSNMFQKNCNIAVCLNFENYSPSLNQIIIRHNGSSYCDLPIVLVPLNETNMTLDKNSEGFGPNKKIIPGFDLLAIICAVCASVCIRKRFRI